MGGKKFCSHIKRLYNKHYKLLAIPFVLSSLLMYPTTVLSNSFPTIPSKNRRLLTPGSASTHNPTNVDIYQKNSSLTSLFSGSRNAVTPEARWSNGSPPSVPEVDTRPPVNADAGGQMNYKDDNKEWSELDEYGWGPRGQDVIRGPGNIFFEDDWLPEDYYGFAGTTGTTTFGIPADKGGIIFRSGVNRISSIATNYNQFSVEIYNDGWIGWDVELYSGRIVLYRNSKINDIGAMKVAIRGANFGTSGTQKGIHVSSYDGIIYGVVQGGNQNDTIEATGLSIYRADYFPNTGFINLREGNDVINITGNGILIQDPGHIFMGEGNDTIKLNANANSIYIKGSIALGSGNDSMSIINSNTNFIYGNIFGEAGNDTLQLQAANFTLNHVYMGEGNDSILINKAPNSNNSKYITLDLGSGNNTIEIQDGTRAMDRIAIEMGNGDDLVYLNGINSTRIFSLGKGINTIKLFNGTYSANNLNIETESTRSPSGVILQSTKGSFTIGTVTNNGLFGIDLGTSNATYKGPTKITTGRVSVHLYDGAVLNSDFISGEGNDTYHFENVRVNHNINANGGDNSIVLDRSTFNNILNSSGNDTVTVSQSTVSAVNLYSADRKNVTLSNVRFNNGDGFLMDNAKQSSLNLDGIIDFTDMKSIFRVNNGSHNITINALNMVGNLVDIDIDTSQNNTVTLTGNITRAGNVYLGEGRNNVTFKGATTNLNAFGIFQVGLGDDSILLTEGTQLGGGTLDFRTASTNGDTLHLINSTILRGAEILYAGKFNLTMNEASSISNNFTTKDTTNIIMTHTSVIDGGIRVASNKHIDINMFDTSHIVQPITVENSINLNMTLYARNNSSVSGDIISGNFNDSVLMDIVDEARFTGLLTTNAGNDTISIRNTSKNSNISSIDLGIGDDSLVLRGGTFAGSGNLVLGTGLNNVLFQNENTIANDFVVNEANNTQNTFIFETNSRVDGSLFTGHASANVILNENTKLTGQINAQSSLGVTIKNNSTVTGSIIMGNGDSTISMTGALLEGELENNRGGAMSAVINNSTIKGGVASISPKAAHITLNSSRIENSIMTHDTTLIGKNNIFGKDILIEGNANISLHSSTVQGQLVLTEGDSTIHFTDSIINNGISTTKGMHNLSLKNGKVLGGIIFNQATINFATDGTVIEGDVKLLAQVRPFTSKAIANSISITGGSISGSIVAGGNSENNFFSFKQTSLKGSIEVGLGDNTIFVQNSTVGGDIHFKGTTTTTLDHVTLEGILDFSNFNLGDQNLTIIGGVWDALSLANVKNIVNLNSITLKSNGTYSIRGGNKADTASISNSEIQGSILVENIIFGGVVALNNTTPTISTSFDIGENSGRTRFENSSLHVTPNNVGDTVNLYGNMQNNSGTITIDADFITGVHDTLIIKQNAKFAGSNQFLIVKPNNIFDGSQPILEIIPDVLIAESKKSFERLPNLKNVYMSAGGNLYQLLQDENKINHFNLAFAGEDPLNYGYAVMALSQRNYTRSFLEGLDIQNSNSLLGTSTKNSNYGKQNVGDHIALWVNASISSNKVSSPLAPTVNEVLAIGTVGLDIKELNYRNTDRFGIRFFGGYGYSIAKYKYEHWDFTGTLNAYSAGLQFSWENLRGDERYRAFIRVSSWADIYKNDLSNPITFSPEEWSSYSINATINAGYRILAKKFTIIPEIEMLYSYNSGSQFITANNSLIQFKEANQLILKASTTAAYTFDMGLSPYVKIALEVPVLVTPEDANGAFIAGKHYSYDVDDILTRIGLGLNYSVSISGFDISTFVDVSVHVGRESGIRGNIGLSLGF